MGPYDVRGDVDLDGDVDEDDSSVIAADYSGIVLGREVLSDSDVWNRRGHCGRSIVLITCVVQGRQRVLHAEHGRWTSRDHAEYVDGPSLYQAMKSSPVALIDPTGQKSCSLPLPHAGGAGGGLPAAIMENHIQDPGGDPMTKEECCEEGFKQRKTNFALDFGNAAGGGVCCNGTTIICNWTDKFSEYTKHPTSFHVVKHCIDNHENAHLGSGDLEACDGPHDFDGKPADWNPATYGQYGTSGFKLAEAYAREATLLEDEISCLHVGKHQCEPTGPCIDTINGRIKTLETALKKYRGEADG